MGFHSILFPSETMHSDMGEQGKEEETVSAVDFFDDLNLNQIIDGIVARKPEYQLRQYFTEKLTRVEDITYRHEVFRDVEQPATWACINNFTKRMEVSQRWLLQAGQLHDGHQSGRWFLDGVMAYCEAVRELSKAFHKLELSSRGLMDFRNYLTTYAQSPGFHALSAEAHRISNQLNGLRYYVHIQGNTVHVHKSGTEEGDYSLDVTETFAKFQQGAVRDYRVEFRESVTLNHVEAQILQIVSQLYPEVFGQLHEFETKNQAFVDDCIFRFHRELQFYMAYLEHISGMKRAGLAFCYPKVVQGVTEVYSSAGFDLALADKLVTEGSDVVCNDFYLAREERIFVVSGPNQGGKTTFARLFGQMHFLANLGCPVPGRDAQLQLYDNLFTHFEREEAIDDLRGRLQDDLVRIHDILQAASPHSILILNETFSSTTLQDAVFLGKEVLGRIEDIGNLCVFVTFMDELSALNHVVSLVSVVPPQNPAERTYKIVRKKADGRAYALWISERHNLTEKRIKERLQHARSSNV